jgi:transposase-like protein
MRRRYTTEERKQFLEQVRSGGSVREVARRLGLNPSVGYRWVQAVGEPSAPKFGRLVSAGPSPRAAITLQVGGATVRVEAGFDSEVLRAVVCALSAALK